MPGRARWQWHELVLIGGLISSISVTVWLVYMGGTYMLGGAIEQQQQQQQQWEVSAAAGNVAAASILARGTNLGGILNDVVVNDTPIRNDDINAVTATIQADAAAELQADAAAAAAAADTLATAMAAASGFNVGHEPVGEEYVDILVVVEASDVPTLLLNGMPSIFKYVDKVGHVYIVGTAEACRALNTWLASITGDSNGARLRISVVSEQSFGFKLDDMRGHDSKPGWVFQQCLKLYGHRMLSPKPRSTLLVMDADVTWLGPVQFFDFQSGKSLFNVGTMQSGAFRTDVEQLRLSVTTVLDGLKPAFDAAPVTMVSHHMLMQRDVVNTLLDAIERESNGAPAWQRLKDTRPWLSEYEVYTAWIYAQYPDRIGLRVLPYANTWDCTAPAREWWKANTDVIYLACHDDYYKGNKHGVPPNENGGSNCCVGSSTTLCLCCGYQQWEEDPKCHREHPLRGHSTIEGLEVVRKFAFNGTVEEKAPK